MAWDTIVGSLELVKDIQSPSILFYGGEPTTESELMMATMDEALLDLDHPRFGFTTNGMFLTRGLLNDLSAYPISVAFSHNRTRQGPPAGAL